MKNSIKSVVRIPLLSLFAVNLNFTLATMISPENTKAAEAFLIAQGVSCNVTNIQKGQLALRFSPNGKSKSGLNNGNTVEVLRYGSGVWSYVRVLDGPNNRVNGLKGWVNSNYLACGGTDDSGNFENVVVFAPPSKVRTSPNGEVQCTITKRQVIKVYAEPQSSWYSTTACGGGWIHESQIRF